MTDQKETDPNRRHDNSKLSPLRSAPRSANPACSADKTRLKRAMSTPTLRLPEVDKALYQRSQTINSPGLSPSLVNNLTSEVDEGTSQVFVTVFIAPAQDPLTGVERGK